MLDATPTRDRERACDLQFGSYAESKVTGQREQHGHLERASESSSPLTALRGCNRRVLFFECALLHRVFVCLQTAFGAAGARTVGVVLDGSTRSRALSLSLHDAVDGTLTFIHYTFVFLLGCAWKREWLVELLDGTLRQAK